MKRKDYRGAKCTKRKIEKSIGVCKTYGELEAKYADILSLNENVKEFETCVPIDCEFVSDFVITKKDNTIAVRECVPRELLIKPRMAKLLDVSKNYWYGRGVSDWKIVTNEEE